MAATSDGGGYWLVASDGGIFSFGDAKFYGSTGAIHLNQPVVGMAATSDGHGYWLVASDGGIFNFGDAKFYGSTGAIALNQPVVGMAATTSGSGYRLVAADGGIFNFGAAQPDGCVGRAAPQQADRGDGRVLISAPGLLRAAGGDPGQGAFAAAAPPRCNRCTAARYWLSNDGRLRNDGGPRYGTRRPRSNKRI